MREPEWEGWLRHQRDELATLSTQGHGEGVRTEIKRAMLSHGLNGQHWRRKRGEMGRGGGMRRWVVVSHSSIGHIRANGSLLPSYTHTQTHDTHEDMLTHFCLRGCGKPTLLGKERGRKRKRRSRRKGVWKREGNTARVGGRAGGQGNKEWKGETVRVWR